MVLTANPQVKPMMACDLVPVEWSVLVRAHFGQNSGRMARKPRSQPR
jgi:hypothetical protein